VGKPVLFIRATLDIFDIRRKLRSLHPAGVLVLAMHIEAGKWHGSTEEL